MKIRFILLTIFLFISLELQAAVNFDGTDDFIVLPASINNNLNATNISVAAWVYADALNTFAWVITEKFGAPSVRFALGSFSANNFSVAFYDGTWRVAQTLGTTGTWKHLLGTYNGSVLRLYVDGVEAATTNYTGTMSGNDSWRIGRRHDNANYFNGSIDDARIYNRALSAVEVEALYKARRKRVSGNLVNGLVAHYEMDDAQIGSVAGYLLDESGNGIHGQFTNFENTNFPFSNNIPANLATGQSLTFDGVDDYLISSASFSDLRSVSVWFNAASNVGHRRIFQWGSNGYSVYLNSGGYLVKVIYDNNDVSTGFSATANTWYHLVTTFNGTTVRTYIDNQEIHNFLDSANDTAKTFYLGSTIGDQFWNGLIDNVRAYNKALSAAEISYLYNGSGMNPGTANLQVLWSFDNYPSLKDSSGNSNHGIGVGGSSLKYSEGILKR